MNLKPLTEVIEVHVEAPVYPSEDFYKVAKAIENIIQDVSVSLEGSNPAYLRGVSRGAESLTKIYNQLRSRATLSAARRLLFTNASEGSTWIFFNKQAALSGVVAVCQEESESPLGPVRVTISADNIMEFIDWLAPQV